MSAPIGYFMSEDGYCFSIFGYDQRGSGEGIEEGKLEGKVN